MTTLSDALRRENNNMTTLRELYDCGEIGSETMIYLVLRNYTEKIGRLDCDRMQGDSEIWNIPFRYVYITYDDECYCYA